MLDITFLVRDSGDGSGGGWGLGSEGLSLILFLLMIVWHILETAALEPYDFTFTEIGYLVFDHKGISDTFYITMKQSANFGYMLCLNYLAFMQWLVNLSPLSNYLAKPKNGRKICHIFVWRDVTADFMAEWNGREPMKTAIFILYNGNVFIVAAQHAFGDLMVDGPVYLTRFGTSNFTLQLSLDILKKMKFIFLKFRIKSFKFMSKFYERLLWAELTLSFNNFQKNAPYILKKKKKERII
ncbi:hypothetical protein ACJX0J_023470 [Zea mays]